MVPLYSDGDKWRRSRETTFPTSGLRYRTEFRRDYARVIHSAAFRRLQGKTQLFPPSEMDFFRNRLTHSLEVAQIAKSIALKLNTEEEYLRTLKPRSDGMRGIDVDIVEVAGLAHDLGHPPFGHNGERHLNTLMRKYGGFESNAQTLRILTRLEKKTTEREAPANALLSGIARDGADHRVGINMTARGMAAVLKYDKEIPEKGTGGDLKKGYYRSEAKAVEQMKHHVLEEGNSVPSGAFRSIESQIMDIADDIAFATYDLEDAFKASLLGPIDLFSASQTTLELVANKVSKAVSIEQSRVDEPPPKEDITAHTIQRVLMRIFEPLLKDVSLDNSMPDELQALDITLKIHEEADRLARSGYLRVAFTTKLVGEFIEGANFKLDAKNPQLSKVFLDYKSQIEVETLKRLIHELVVQSPRVQIWEVRSREIMSQVFCRLMGPNGENLLPNDYRQIIQRLGSSRLMKARIVCDFIAGMTDSYLLEIHERLTSSHSPHFFKPIW